MLDILSLNRGFGPLGKYLKEIVLTKTTEEERSTAGLLYAYKKHLPLFASKPNAEMRDRMINNYRKYIKEASELAIVQAQQLYPNLKVKSTFSKDFNQYADALLIKILTKQEPFSQHLDNEVLNASGDNFLPGAKYVALVLVFVVGDANHGTKTKVVDPHLVWVVEAQLCKAKGEEGPVKVISILDSSAIK